MPLTVDRSERGASAVLVAVTVLLLVGFAAFAIDLSVGFNERRQDQTAADVGVMAGAIETLGPNTLIRDMILDFSRRNVVATYSNGEWQALWEGCDDSTERAALNSTGFNFVPVTLPPGWSTATGRLDCISIDASGFIRVNLPQLEFDTAFARLMGFETMESSAAAIARLAPRGGGSILPFGLPVGAGDGQVCLRDSAGGIAEPPCDGTESGNFGAIESPHYGTQPDGPAQNCTGSPKKDILTVNIAYGIDHRIIPDPNGNGTGEVLDTCASMDAGMTPNTLNTFTGISSGLEEGIATGPVPGGIAPPLLQQGSNPKRNVYGHPLDDKPLWAYIDPGLQASDPGVDIPEICEADSFDGGEDDWVGDGPPLEPNRSWQHLNKCLEVFVNGDGGAHPAPYTTPIFMETLKESPRFGYVPMFWEAGFGPGNSWKHVKMFKATFLQTTWWKKGSTTTAFHPGEAGSFTGGGSWSLIQLSGLVIPDGTLPIDLRGDPPPGGGVEPFRPELYR